jgi:hypothetical protein
MTAPNGPDPLCSAFTPIMVALGAMPRVPIVLSSAAIIPATCVPCQKVPTSWLKAKPGTNDLDAATSRFPSRS